MTRPAGPAADTARYEHWWTLSECLRLLHGAADALRVEALDAGRAALVVTADARREIHHARREHPRGAWTPGALDAGAGRLLETIGDRLADNGDLFVLVSGSDARELAEPCAAAGGAESAEAFERDWLTTRVRREWFARLLRRWICGAAAAVDRLRRVDVRTVGETTLEQQVRRGAQALFAADPGAVVPHLLAVAQDAERGALTRRELVERLARRGFRPRGLRSPERAGEQAAAVTDRYLDGARRGFLGGRVTPRAPAARLAARLRGGAGESVLTGRPGAGKTACAAGVVDALRARGTPVLALRLDHVDTAATTIELGRLLGLEESPVLVLAEAARAAGRPGVLLVDQVDPAAGPARGGPDAGGLAERLVHEARGIRPRAAIHTVLACRAFDWRNDPRLRRLLPGGEARIDVPELDRGEVVRMLADAGFDPASAGEGQLEILRLPQHLRIFLESGAEAPNVLAFNSPTALFDRYWNAKRRAVAARAAPLADQWMTAVGTLCDELTSARTRTAPVERLDEVSPAWLDHLAAEGVVTLAGRRCGFAHETFFDYCAARVSFNRREPLTSWLKGSEQHLFRRARIRQTLAYLRGADPALYARELDRLLADEGVRPHVKDLCLALLADAPDPTEREWAIWERWIAPALRPAADGAARADPLSALAWRRFFESPSWFAFAERRGVIEGALAADDERTARTALGYLGRHQRQAPDPVAGLLEPYAGVGGAWTARLRSFMEGAAPQASRRFFELFLRLIDDGALDEARGRGRPDATFWSLLRGLGEQRPEWVPEVVARRLRRRLAVLRSAREDLGGYEAPGYDDDAARIFARAAREAAGAFVKHVLPPLLALSDAALTGTTPPRRDAVWPVTAAAEHPEADHACLSALAAALGALARDGDPAAADALAELRRRDTHVANRLLLAACEGGAARYADEAAALLCDQPWRFECGFSDDPRRHAAETIRAVAPRCAAASRERLEQALLAYVAPDERGILRYRQSGRARLALLSAIPAELRGPRAAAEAQALERRFGKSAGEPRTIAVDSAAAPVDDGAAETMTDRQWLDAIARRRPKAALPGLRGGGKDNAPPELAGRLEARAAVDPERFAALALKLPADAHPAYLDRTLAGLRDAAAPAELKLEVCQKAFVEARGPCGRSIAEALGSIREPLPADAVRMLHWLATEHEDPAAAAWRTEDLGVETARGSAARAVRNLILQDASCLPRLRVTVDRLVRDPSASVRARAAGVVRAVAGRDPALGMKLFRALDLSEDRLLAAPEVVGFVHDNLRGRFPDVRPFLERMLRSPADEVREAGGRLATLAALEHAGAGGLKAGETPPAVAAMSAQPEDRGAADLAAEARRGQPAHRLGVARAAAANLAVPEYRAWSEAALIALFDDDDGAVRRRAAACFRHVKDTPLEPYGGLMEAFCRSRAFGDDPASILNTLEASRERLPGAVCVVCETFLDRFGAEAREARGDRRVDALTVAALAFRVCRQHPDDEWTKRALDLVDRLCLERIGDAPGALERFET